ncbi:uncharacterized protein LOC106655633 [Trichogramma pretiosum]|uniref:uncharacterized protein LOC106655633 n=1 Tax=Trichogramma pretiosum TaxID=7493 RepID=UPI0006C97A64|nr:uncharacterized protein LOC106655633 [Trichogramma pretiosum]
MYLYEDMMFEAAQAHLQKFKTDDERRKEFFHLVHRSAMDTDQLLSLLHATFPDVSQHSELLSRAIDSDDRRVVEFLVRHDELVRELKFEDGRSAYHHISLYDKTRRMLKLFFGHVTADNCRYENGFTYFHGACWVGNVDAVLAMIAKKPEVVNLDSWMFTPLFVACRFRHERIVEILLEHGADVHGEDMVGRTALHALALIVACDCRVDANSRAASICGSRKPLGKMVEMLLEKGADVNACPRLAESPLQMAVSYFDAELAKKLLDHGASLDGLKKDELFAQEFTPFEVQNFPLTLDIVETVNFLKSVGLKWDLRDQLRMLRYWMKLRRQEPDRAVVDFDKCKDGAEMLSKDVFNIYDKLEFHMKPKTETHLRQQHEKCELLNLRITYFDFMRYDLALDKEATMLEGIRVNENISLYQICQLNYEQAYEILSEILKNTKDWRVPELHDLHLLKPIVKRRVADILIRRHLETFFIDLESTKHRESTMSRDDFKKLTRTINYDDLYRYCEDKDESDLPDCVSIPTKNAINVANNS